jgi:para-nitrobenzyl esterase
MAAFLWIHVYKLSRKKAWIRLASWLILFAALAVIYIISYPPYKPVPAVSAKNPQPSGTITLEQGALTGVCNGDGSVEVYTGIPYAKAPVGDLRWREPQEPDQWEGVLVCDHFAPRFMQHEYSTLWDSLVMLVIYNEFDWFDPGDNFREPMSEDALYVNIWKPRGDISGCPVIFFIHGGSLQTGTPSYDQYNGEAFARRGIVFVDFGYRLNVFGYFADEALALESSNKTTGNYGLLDQIAALRWVHENIRAFGGDPDNITIAGESAGASSVNALCVSPLARGLFRRAIAESSGITANRPYHTFRSYEDALDMKSAVYEAMGAASVDELRKIDARTLVRAAGEYNSMTVDGYAIQKQPALIYQAGENNEEALLNGFNSSEADVFSILGTRVTKENYAEILNDKLGSAGEAAARLYPAGDAPKAQYNEVMSGAWFAYSHHTWSRYLATQNRPVYEYWFTKTNRGLSDNHAGELPYFYGNLDSQKQNYNSTDYDLSETIMDYLENYVRNGNPNGEGLTEWTDFSEDETQLLELGEHIGMTRDPYLELYKALDKAQSESNTPLQAEGHE